MDMDELLFKLKAGANVVIPVSLFDELTERMGAFYCCNRFSLKFSPKGTVTIKMIK